MKFTRKIVDSIVKQVRQHMKVHFLEAVECGLRDGAGGETANSLLWNSEADLNDNLRLWGNPGFHGAGALRLPKEEVEEKDGVVVLDLYVYGGQSRWDSELMGNLDAVIENGVVNVTDPFLKKTEASR